MWSAPPPPATVNSILLILNSKGGAGVRTPPPFPLENLVLISHSKFNKNMPRNLPFPTANTISPRTPSLEKTMQAVEKRILKVCPLPHIHYIQLKLPLNNREVQKHKKANVRRRESESSVASSPSHIRRRIFALLLLRIRIFALCSCIFAHSLHRSCNFALATSTLAQ